MRGFNRGKATALFVGAARRNGRALSVGVADLRGNARITAPARCAGTRRYPRARYADCSEDVRGSLRRPVKRSLATAARDATRRGTLASSLRGFPSGRSQSIPTLALLVRDRVRGGWESRSAAELSAASAASAFRARSARHSEQRRSSAAVQFPTETTPSRFRSSAPPRTTINLTRTGTSPPLGERGHAW
jgi:hypothetical protein